MFDNEDLDLDNIFQPGFGLNLRLSRDILNAADLLSESEPSFDIEAFVNEMRQDVKTDERRKFTQAPRRNPMLPRDIPLNAADLLSES